MKEESVSTSITQQCGQNIWNQKDNSYHPTGNLNSIENFLEHALTHSFSFVGHQTYGTL